MLNARLLRQFIAVAEELHYGRAAQRVGIAQSPLSQAIQRLEVYVGTPLFLRNKRSVALTPAGRVFLEEAHQWLQYERIAVERAQHAAGGEIGQLSIGFIGSAGYGFMPELIGRFRSLYPQVRLRVVEMTTRDQLDQLKGRSLDVGLLRTPLPQEGAMIHTRLHQYDRLMAAVPLHHPLAGRKRIALRELAQDSFVAFSRDKVPAAHAQLISACATAGFHPRIEQECAQVASVVCLVAAGLSVALIPSNLASLIHPKVRYIPLSDKTESLRQEISLAWRRDDDNPALACFLDAARPLSMARG
ncbi:LysR family transcriptional regulator [Bordetella sp. H567]|uniref:LysR family transcriptional regulator n=1 Tax=Bordetella sp. H567 TaxID=1697043 RepID=UPI0009F678A1|nr:LysR family transcriptional regulator [Bordetella sp. H567]